MCFDLLSLAPIGSVFALAFLAPVLSFSLIAKINCFNVPTLVPEFGEPEAKIENSLNHVLSPYCTYKRADALFCLEKGKSAS